MIYGHFGQTSELVLRLDDEPVRVVRGRDERMAWLTDRIGDLTIRLTPDPFQALAMSIIGQQLSVKAASAIQQRVIKLVPAFTPESLLDLDASQLREAGLSRAKVVSIHDLSAKTVSGEIELDKLHLMDDEAIISMVTRVKGIGRWTAEMFLLFSLGRLDVLSAGDLGLQKAFKWLYALDERPDKAWLEKYGERWSPYRSVASFYLWESLNRGLDKEVKGS
jgi:DNA-3-methyladenine glycosylase II